MPIYVVNKNAQPNSRDHEVHDLASTKDCLPIAANQLRLGYFGNCADAVRAAKQYYGDVNGCYYCVPACHTT